MSAKTRTSECNNGYCLFVRDPNNHHRYVCLKCGLERHLDESEDPNPPIVLIIFTTIILTLLLV